MKTADIRQTFLDFFQEKKHYIASSSSLIPHNDPTLFFTNSGMVQFKDIFTRKDSRPYVKAATCQKCLRASGKHNDLEQVGYTARHHTFFEMLGNFSFGDYFKEKAILYAWELLTKVFSIDPERLLITVYHTDEEAFSLWKKIAQLPDQRIIRISTNDNFWTMGDIGPCGPCSEIFYDHGEHIAGGPPGSFNEDGDRFVEIWNLVFMQYEQFSQKKREMLPKPSIDTGAGIERVSAVLQGVVNNYETDIFQSLIQEAVEFAGKFYKNEDKKSYHVIADHIRSISFLIADGILPSNEGRGYVLRRILRRALRYAYFLTTKPGILERLVPTLINKMGGFYPELHQAKSLIFSTLHQEEMRFHDLLEKGLPLLNAALKNISKGEKFPGDIAFKLYDTYGFPLDLVQDELKEKGISVDQERFCFLMKAQKEKARASWAGSGECETESLYLELNRKIKPTVYLGYVQDSGTGIIKALVNNCKETHRLCEGENGEIILDTTPFYAEMGGQVGDKGEIKNASSIFEVHDTLKKGKLFIHRGKMIKGSFTVSEHVVLEIHREENTSISANHSATHLLYAALRKLFGDHVIQKGSFVCPERLRFDFSHHQALTPKEIEQLEQMVNQAIWKNIPVITEEMEKEKALETGVLSLFGEKYEDRVRVVSIEATDAEMHSKEFCGGTHVARTGDIGSFKILSENSIMSGVRRIEAVTQKNALELFQKWGEQRKALSLLTKTTPENLTERMLQLIEENKQLRKNKAISESSLIPEKEIVGNFSFWFLSLKNQDPKTLKSIMDTMKQQLNDGIIVVTNTVEEKVTVLLGITKKLSQTFSATEILNKTIHLIGGKKAGGRAELAQGGGNESKKLNELLQAIKQDLKEQEIK